MTLKVAVSCFILRKNVAHSCEECFLIFAHLHSILRIIGKHTPKEWSETVRKRPSNLWFENFQVHFFSNRTLQNGLLSEQIVYSNSGKMIE